MRSLLRSVVGSDNRLEVVGTASDGASAIGAVDSLRPDLILLDVEMPGMDGLLTLKQIKSKGSRIPVIMCSSLTQRGAQVTIEALASGASDYVAKPSGQPSRDVAIRSLAQDLIPKILALTASQTAASHTTPPRQGIFSPAPAVRPASRAIPGSLSRIPMHVQTTDSGNPFPTPALGVAAGFPSGFSPAVVVIAVSTGGPAALDILLPALPADFPVPVLIVQHMPEMFTRLLAERLDSRCRLRITEAEAGEPIRSGAVYIAKGDWHLEVAPAPDRNMDRDTDRNLRSPIPVARLTQGAPENHCRPAADVLFRAAVAIYGSRVLGVVLTGMGYDGLAGCRRIREQNGAVIAQDQATSAVWGMPGAVAQAGLANRILPLNQIAPEILRLAGRGQREALELRESAV
jgi:two-component system chemotaxis response regulator CheB